MKKLFLLLNTLLSTVLISGSVYADQYPGDFAFTDIVQRVYHQVSADSINMSSRPNIINRHQLCSTLVNRHNNWVAPGVGESNANFINLSLTQSDCLNALWYSNGYSSSAGWRAWAGFLTGSWFNDDEEQFPDGANWLSPVPIIGFDNRTYQLQSVLFGGRTGISQFGWNSSHPNVDYVWGWDGKDNNNQNGERGTHVGWTFSKGTAQCIIWATPEEAFLECVKPKCAGKQRVSVGFSGMGQWNIGDASCGTTSVGKTRPFRPIEPISPIEPIRPYRPGFESSRGEPLRNFR